MLSILSWLFWFAVYIGALFVMAMSLTEGAKSKVLKSSETDIPDQDDTTENETSPSEPSDLSIELQHLNWSRTGLFLISSVTAIYAAPTGFYFITIASYSVFSIYLAIKIFAFYGIEFNEGGLEKLKTFFEHSNQVDALKSHSHMVLLGAGSICIPLMFFALGSADFETEPSYSSSSSESSSSRETKYSLRARDGCPVRDGEDYASSPSYAAGEIFRIAASRGGNQSYGLSECRRCATQTRQEALGLGVNVQGMGPMWDFCHSLYEKYQLNRAVWDALGD